MSKRTTSENSSEVGLFPFLAVLLCTMGALLVLLVVMAQRAGKQIVAESTVEVEVLSSSPVDESQLKEFEKLKIRLADVQRSQSQLNQLKEQTEKKLQEEKQRLGYLEERTRKLEHELAELLVASEQLKATENNQEVDQAQAESQLTHLQKLIEEKTKLIEELQDEGGNKSYAIVPYQGSSGTYRRPIYIECSSRGIILQPEGVLLEELDFRDISWPGNPLASAIRASREYLNAKAAQAGRSEPPDPYPMILIRPDGMVQYSQAKSAIKAWGADYGYEFVDGEWEIEYPELPDPQLAQVQEHAVINARMRLQRRMDAAPSRFKRVELASGSGWGRGGGSSSRRNGNSVSNTGNNSNSLLEQPDGNSNGNGSFDSRFTSKTDEAGNSTSSQQSEFQYGSYQSGPSAGEQSGGYPGSPTTGSAGAYLEGPDTDGGTGASGSSCNGLAKNGVALPANQAGGPNGDAGSFSDSTSDFSGSQGTEMQAQNQVRRTPNLGNGAITYSGTSPSNQNAPIAETRGKNWAVESRSARSVPIRRKIQVVVQKDRLAILPNRHALQGTGETGKVIMLNKNQQQVADEFVAALREQIKDWGLAGSGLYWSPVLELTLGPDAQQTADQFASLLQDSGIEVQLPQTAQRERSHVR